MPNFKLKERAIEIILRKYYSKSFNNSLDIAEICAIHPTSPTILRYKHSKIKEKHYNLIVNVVLTSKTIEQQKFFDYYYRQKKTFTYISIKLNVSTRSLNYWKKIIIEEIFMLINYRIPYREYLSLDKLRIILLVLDEDIAIFSRLNEKSDAYIKKLKLLRTRYYTLHVNINKILEESDDRIGLAIIQEKIKNNSLTNEEIAYKYDVSLRYVNQKIKDCIEHLIGITKYENT